MKASLGSLLAGLAILVALSPPSASAAPAPCSVSVGIAVRTGLSFRTWTNALETMKLEEKGLKICQDDAILNLSDDRLAELDEVSAAALLKCQTEFKLELLYYGPKSGKPTTTRNITIYDSRGRALFDRDFEGNPASQRMLKSIPTCAELQALGASR